MTSENSPVVSDLSSCHGSPAPRRPNQRKGRPSRACSPAASAPAATGFGGCNATMHSMSGSGCGVLRSAIDARAVSDKDTGAAAYSSTERSVAIRFWIASGGS